MAEDIAHVELRPTFISIVDNSALGADVLKKLNNHRVDTRYIQKIPSGMGTWLAVFDNHGDLAGSISQRSDMMPIMKILEENGDEIFSQADSIVVQADMHKDLMKKVFALADKYKKKIFAIVSNMSIAVERRDLLQKVDCFVCNQLEAGMLFADDYSEKEPAELCEILAERVMLGKIPAMIVTMGGKGSVYADMKGNKGFCPARQVMVKDTTGAGDAFFAGVTIGLTYGKTLAEATQIGTNLAASVITSSENVCPRFLPRELGLDMDPIE